MVWTPNRPLLDLPQKIREHYVIHAGLLLDNLEINQHTVELVGAPYPQFEGHKIRVVTRHSPEWYMDLYYDHTGRSKRGSSFRRDLSLRALDRICNLKDRPFMVSPFLYDSIYRGFIHDELLKGYDRLDQEDDIFAPINEVRVYFGLKKVDMRKYPYYADEVVEEELEKVPF